MTARIHFPSRAELEAERADRERTAARRASGAGPAPKLCDECGADAPFASGDFGRPDDVIERYCRKHLPSDFLPRP